MSSQAEVVEYDLAQIVGPYAWDILHHVVENFPCSHCAEEGGKLLRGLHDLVNHQLDKPMEYPEDFRFLAELVREAAADLDVAGAVPMSTSALDAEVARLAKEQGLLASNQSDALFGVCEGGQQPKFHGRCRGVFPWKDHPATCRAAI